MKRKDLLSALDEIAPLALQESWDNCGMQIDLGRTEYKKLLVCLDITDDILKEAVEAGCDLIISHHPLLFHGVKQISENDELGRRLIRLIRHGISVYSAHTNFDKALGGNNDDLLDRIGVVCLAPLSAGQDESVIGRTGVFGKPLKLRDAAERVAEGLGRPVGLKVAGDPERLIRKVGVCTGAGGEFYKEAAECGCDLYISGDVKHHEVLAALGLGLCLIDGGHYGTEWIFSENMARQLRKKAETYSDSTEILETTQGKNPFLFSIS